MKSLLRYSLVLVALLAAAAVEAKSPVKKFSGDGFKIVQFTDLHWVSKKREINDSTLALMDKVIRDEKPDLAVLTGDIVTWNSVPDAVAAWKEIMAFMDERNLDFVVGFGNHDPENGTLTKKEIMDLLKESPHNLTFNDDKSLPGQGNCYLQVKDQAGRKALWNLYFFDSHDYNRDKKISGHYGWIEFDQVAWYRRLSDRLNKGKETKTPALAFFHIPLPEYVPADSASVYGSIKDFGRGAPELNSGLFHSFVEKNDVFGTFCGHDHNDDYALVYDGICMCYGRKTGFNPAYKEVLPRGARIIVLHPDKPTFDTYIIDQEGHCLDYSFTKTR
jgi:hypothetical protein